MNVQKVHGVVQKRIWDAQTYVQMTATPSMKCITLQQVINFSRVHVHLLETDLIT